MFSSIRSAFLSLTALGVLGVTTFAWFGAGAPATANDDPTTPSCEMCLATPVADYSLSLTFCSPSVQQIVLSDGTALPLPNAPYSTTTGLGQLVSDLIALGYDASLVGSQLTITASPDSFGFAQSSTGYVQDFTKGTTYQNPACEAICAEPPTVTPTTEVCLTKVVVNGEATPEDFLLFITQTGTDDNEAKGYGPEICHTYDTVVDGRQLTASEQDPMGYDVSFSGDCDAEGHYPPLVTGGSYNCTITNFTHPTPEPLPTAEVCVNKVVDGGPLSPSDVTLTLTKLGYVGTSAPGPQYCQTYTIGNGLTVVAGEQPIADHYTATFSGDCDPSGTVEITEEGTYTCTITNTYTPPVIEPPVPATAEVCVRKVVEPGGPLTASDFTLTQGLAGARPLSGPGPELCQEYTLSPATIRVIAGEVATDNYSGTFSGDCDARGALTISEPGKYTCTIYNEYTPIVTPPAPQTKLCIAKEVVGGKLSPENFVLSLQTGDGQLVTEGPGPLVCYTFTGDTLPDATFLATETPVANYDATFSGDCSLRGVFTDLTVGETHTCTITNTYDPPVIVRPTAEVCVTKVVEGGPLAASDFTLTQGPEGYRPASGSGPEFCREYTLTGLDLTVMAGEVQQDNYEAEFSGDCDATGAVNIHGPGQYNCTITNTYDPPIIIDYATTLCVEKVVEGGTMTDSDFTLTLTNGQGWDYSETTNQLCRTIRGSNPSQFTFTAGEQPVYGYDATFSGDCDANGVFDTPTPGHYTCTITNTYDPPVIVRPTAEVCVTKVVEGGPLTAADFTLQIIEAAGLPITKTGQGPEFCQTYDLATAPNHFIISEISTDEYEGVISGDCDANGVLTLNGPGQYNCTITNTYQAPEPDPDTTEYCVVKVVEGGPLTPADFQLSVKSNYGQTTYGYGPKLCDDRAITKDYMFFIAGEIPQDNYTAEFSGDCDANGVYPSANPGETLTCVITNTYQAPEPTTATICVEKVLAGDPSPLAADEFTLSLTDGADYYVEEQTQQLCQTVTPTTDTVFYASEAPVSADYAVSYSGDCDSTGQLTDITAGEAYTCTITNTYTAPVVDPELTTAEVCVAKVVTGDGPLTASDFTLTLTDGADYYVEEQTQQLCETITITDDLTVIAGELAVANYAATYSGDCDSTGQFTDLTAGESYTCTITNEYYVIVTPDPDPVTTFCVQKVVSGGPNTASDFTLSVTSTDTASAAVVSSVAGTGPTFCHDVTNPDDLDGRTFTAGETQLAGYTAAYSGDCDTNGVYQAVDAGDTLVCTIVNTYPIQSLTTTNSGSTVTTTTTTGGTSTSGGSSSGGGGGSTGSYRPSTGTPAPTEPEGYTPTAPEYVPDAPAADCQFLQYDRNPDNLVYSNIIPSTGATPDWLRERYQAFSIFPDTSANHPYYQAAVDLYYQNVAEGYDNAGVMGLDYAVTRAEVSKMVVRAAEMTIKVGCLPQFYPDVTADDWFDLPVSNLTDQGIVSGFPDGLFRPGAPVNFGQLSKIVANAFALPMGTATTQWQDQYYYALLDANLLPPAMIGPNYGRQLTRGEVFEVLRRAMRMADSGESSYVDTVRFDAPQVGISNLIGASTLPSDSSVWLTDLTDLGAGYYYDPVHDNDIFFAHSSVWGGDPNPAGAVFQPMVDGFNVGETFTLTKNGVTRDYVVISRQRVIENQITALRDGDPDTDAILFTCDRDLQYRHVLYATEL